MSVNSLLRLEENGDIDELGGRHPQAWVRANGLLGHHDGKELKWYRESEELKQMRNSGELGWRRMCPRMPCNGESQVFANWEGEYTWDSEPWRSIDGDYLRINTEFEFLLNQWVSKEGVEGFKGWGSLGASEVDIWDGRGGRSNIGSNVFCAGKWS